MKLHLLILSLKNEVFIEVILYTISDGQSDDGAQIARRLGSKPELETQFEALGHHSGQYAG